MSSRPSAPSLQQPGLPLSIGQLGMVLLLLSISVLFLASCAAVLITFRQGSFPVEQGQQSQLSVPWGVLGSTVVLVAIGACLQWGLNQHRRGLFSACASKLRFAGAMAVLFLGLQLSNYAELSAVATSAARDSLFLFSFNLLVGVHAAHVMGGLIYLAICIRKEDGLARSSSKPYPLRYCIQYWHYLGLVWIPLVATLLWVQ